MSARLIKESQENNYQHILAVVGAGHINGMQHHITNDCTNDPDVTIARLDIQPVSSSWFKYLPWAIVLLILTGFIIDLCVAQKSAQP